MSSLRKLPALAGLILGLAPAVLESSIAGHVGKQVRSRGLELVSVQAQVDKEE
jgi:hypothetical protein